MKFKKCMALLLALSLSAAALGTAAGCDNKGNTTTTPNTTGQATTSPTPGGEDTGIQYYIVGTGLGTLAASNWDQTKKDESLKFTRTGNTAVLTAELYEGDEFGIIHNFDWAGQMGMNILANGGKDGDTVVFREGGGYDVKNIQVAPGQSGKYELTLNIKDETDFGNNELTWKLVEKIDALIYTYIAVDGETELSKQVVKKNEVAEPLAYEEVMPMYYEFDGWYTAAEGGEKFDFASAATDSVTLYARVKESPNEAYVEDTHSWYMIGGMNNWSHEAEGYVFEKNSDYTQHNVYSLTVDLFEGQEFKFTHRNPDSGDGWGGKEFLESDIKTGHGRIFESLDGGNIRVKDGAEGKYRFDLFTEIAADGTITGEIFFERVGEVGEVELYEGYYIVGTFLDENGAQQNFVFLPGLTPELTLGEDGKYTATVEFPDNAASFDWLSGGVFAFKCVHVRNSSIDAWYSWADNNDNGLIPEAGAYVVTLDVEAGTFTFTKA